MSIKILCVVGARPNFIKIAPLLEVFDSSRYIEAILVHTGQHYLVEMNDYFFRDLSIRRPDINLEVGSASHAVQTANIMKRFEPLCNEYKPHVVLVTGDVNSTMACALVASKLGIKIAHVEAGLRSFDRSMPEEINRVITDVLADFLFVTEESGLENLRKEGIYEEKVFFVGNVMIDSLIKNMSKIKNANGMNDLNLEKEKYIVVTVHRPTNVDFYEKLKSLVETLCKISEKCKIVFPIHPRTQKKLETFNLYHELENTENVVLTKPLGYIDFLNLVVNAKAVLTDSGGIQEETTYLKIPCITLRETTERPVTSELGSNILVGTDPKKIRAAVDTILEEGIKEPSIPPLWDGKTSERIVQILLKEIS